MTFTELYKERNLNLQGLSTSTHIGVGRLKELRTSWETIEPHEALRISRALHLPIADFCIAAGLNESVSMDAIELDKEREVEYFLQTVPGRMIQLRKERNWSQLELATRAGIGQAQISILETKTLTPRWDTIVRIAAAFELEPFEFLPEPTHELYKSRERTSKKAATKLKGRIVPPATPGGWTEKQLNTPISRLKKKDG